MVYIEVLNYFLVFTAGGLISYYFVISLLALRTNTNISHEAIRTRKFAVILYSQGNGNVLSRSLYSISGLVYPKNKYDLIVIADSYSDSIVQIAKKMGAKILVPPNNQQAGNKNYILPWAFNSLLKGDASYDAIVSFDSDGLISGNYLKVMNYYLEQGSEVIQGSFNNLNNPKSWIGKIREMDYVIDRFVYSLGRKALNQGINLRSNGICFSTALLREFPWEIEKQPSITEYGIDLRLNGIEVDFASPAIVFTEILPVITSKKNYFINQSVSNYQLLRKYMPQFLRRVMKTKSFKHADIFFELVSPKFANLILFALAIGAMNGIGWGLGWIGLLTLILWSMIIGTAITSVYLALIVAGAQQKFRRLVMYIPVTIYLKIEALFKKTRRSEQPIETPNGKEKYLRVPDENQPVQ
jgi:hypothetical protein